MDSLKTIENVTLINKLQGLIYLNRQRSSRQRSSAAADDDDSDRSPHAVLLIIFLMVRSQLPLSDSAQSLAEE